MMHPEHENASMSEYAQWPGMETRPRGDNHDQWNTDAFTPVKNSDYHVISTGRNTSSTKKGSLKPSPQEPNEFPRPVKQHLYEGNIQADEGRNYVDPNFGYSLQTQEDAILIALYGRREGFYDDNELNKLEESWIDAQDYVAIDSTYKTLIQLATIVFLASILFLNSITETSHIVSRTAALFFTSFFLVLATLFSSFGGLTLMILQQNYAKLESRYSQMPHNDGSKHNPVGWAVMKQALRDSQLTRYISEQAVKSSVILLLISVCSSIFMHRAIDSATWVVTVIGILFIVGSIIGLLWIANLAFLNDKLRSKRRTLIGKDQVFDSDILRELTEDMSRHHLLRHFTSQTSNEIEVATSFFGRRQVLLDCYDTTSDDADHDVEEPERISNKSRVVPARNGKNFTSRNPINSSRRQQQRRGASWNPPTN